MQFFLIAIFVVVTDFVLFWKRQLYQATTFKQLLYGREPRRVNAKVGKYEYELWHINMWHGVDWWGMKFKQGFAYMSTQYSETEEAVCVSKIKNKDRAKYFKIYQISKKNAFNFLFYLAYIASGLF